MGREFVLPNKQFERYKNQSIWPGRENGDSPKVPQTMN
jgi:hypothetical protein